MRARLLVPLLFLSAGCSGEVLDGWDAQAVAGDAGVAVADAAAAGSDASAPGPDAGAEQPDAAQPGADASSPGADAGAGLWVTAYIAGWNLNAPPNAAYGDLPATEVDYSAFTHGILFALTVGSDGTLCCIADWDTFAPDRIQATVSGGHAAGRPILFSVGGGGNTDFATAIASDAARATLVDGILDVLDTYGFDGVDLDMEPILAGDEPNYVKLVQELSPRLAARTTPLLPRPLLTAACGSANAAMYASLAASFDQINLMTYDMSGVWDGWVSWHNAPLYDGGFRFPSTNGLVPSADGMVDEMIAAGVPAAKVGIGLDFYGYVWKGGSGTPTGGVTAPRQSWTGAPTVEDNLSYADILATYYDPARYRWDDQAGAAYLSIDAASDADDRFVSYDDETSAAEKVGYVRTKGIGGMIIWEITGDYLPGAPAGERQPVLSAVKAAAGL